MPTSIIIVDDDERICRTLSRNLKREGYLVHYATDGFNMWETLKTSSPELIILDLMLPGADGIRLAHELKEKYPAIGIIMLTAKNDIIDVIVGLEAGADDYITKPFDSRVLLARIHSVLRRMSISTINENNTSSANKSVPLQHD